MKILGQLVSVLLLSAVCGSNALADSPNVPLSAELNAKLNRIEKDQFDAQIRDKLKDVDSIVIRFLPPANGKPTTATLRDTAAIGDLIAHLNEKLSTDTWFKGRVGSEAVKDTVNCQCWGDFEFSFFKKNEFVGKLSVHHWKHIRSESLSGGADTDLEEESMDRLYALAAKLLPAFEVKKPSATPPSVSDRPDTLTVRPKP